MWESPINAIQSEMRMQYEDGVMKAVQRVGFDVNKEELAKALQYDREQYDKGYADAIEEFSERLKERFKCMQMAELQGEDVCPYAEEDCPYMYQDVSCQYCAREQTIKDIAEIAESMKGEKE